MRHPSSSPRVCQPSWFHRLTALFLVLQIGCPPQSYAAAPVFTAVAVQSGYDGNGNVVTRTDGNGVVTSFTYDNVNRLIGIDYPGGSTPDVSFTYDANGNRTRMVDATGTTEYGYNLFDRLTTVEYPDGGFVGYGYDYVGNVTKMRYGNTKALAEGAGFTEIDYTYDQDNRIASVKDVFGNTTTGYTYDDAGNPLRRTLPNGVTTDYGYDGDGRLASVDHKKANGTRICKYTYTLNAIGNRTRVVETLPDASTRTTNYTYDALDRLSAAGYPDGRAVTYVYDSFGNRTKMTEVTGATTKVTDYIYDSDSRLLSTTLNGIADETFFYDTTGNLIQRIRTSDNRQIDYIYDFENRLVRYFDGANNVQYVYDGVGTRVAKIVNGVRTNYVNDCTFKHVQPLSETDVTGNALRNYEWGNELLAQKTTSSSGYYLLDVNEGGVRRIVGATGQILNTYDYDAFGSATAISETLENAYQFHGEASEQGIGLTYLRSRFYDVYLGRFISRDQATPIPSAPKSLNRYSFAENDPVNRTDPSGEVAPIVLYGIAVGLGAAADGLYRLTTPKAERTTLGHITSVAAGASIPLTAGASISLGVGVTTARIAVPAVGFATGATNSAVTSKAQSLEGKAFDAFVGGTLNLPGLSPIKGMNYRNTTTLKGLLTPSNGANLEKEFINQGVNGLSGFLYQEKATDFRNLLWAPDPLIGNFDHWLEPGGVALNRSASVLLDINSITGATYDSATGQVILFGKPNFEPTALPKISLDDLAVAVRAKQLGAFPVVSIEDPTVSNPPEWPGRQCGTVRYGPFYEDSLDGQVKILDLSSKTHFGWVMFEADRLMKSLVLGKDNRTLQTVSSAVPGYSSIVDLNAQYLDRANDRQRLWFEPKEIVVEPSADGTSMQITKAEMQLSTEAAFASGGQAEGSPAAEYFANWFTTKYDAIAEEQVSYDAANQPHKIFKELKQLAYIAGVVKWIDDNNIPVDLAFLKDYQPILYPEAPSVTPLTTVTKTRNFGSGVTMTFTVTGGVDFCHDLVRGTGGNPTGTAAAAVTARPAETSLGWSFSSGGNTYNATAFSVDRTQKDGGMSPAAIDASFRVNGTMPLTLGRYFNSSNITPTLFGWGWNLQPYALEFKGNREEFSICHQSWEGYGEVWFMDRASKGAYKFVAAGVYDKAADPQGLASRFDPTKDILVYRYESKLTPGLLFSDNATRLTMRLDTGELLDFNFDGLLTRVEDRNGNRITYTYDASKRLVSFGEVSGKRITLAYNVQNRVTTATLPDTRTVTYIYDANGNLISAQTAAPTGMIAKYGYDANHNLTELRDENGSAAATQTFDEYGRVTGITQPGVAVPFVETYNLKTRTSQVTGPHGVTRSTEFNEDYAPIKFTDARNKSTTMTYNGYRDMTSVTSADGKTRQFYVDASGHRVATVVPSGRADWTLFDNFGNPVSIFHGPADATFNGLFDADHILTSADPVTGYATGQTQFGYDAKGNRTTITDANSRIRRFGYDSRGNMTSSKDARGKETILTFDTSSRLTKTRNPLGHEVNSTYDAQDNLTQLSNLAGAVNYTYNTKNQVLTMTTGNTGARRTYSYTYDAKGKISTVTDPAGFVTQYTYDARGNLTEIKHDGVVRFAYDYDGLNRLTATRYTGTAGGARASLVPRSPVGTEQFMTGAPIIITWLRQGDWTSNNNVTIQYSTNGTTWTDIATVNSANGTYQWNNPPAGETLRIRFVRTGDSGFRISVTTPFSVFATQKYYVNDNATTGDQYCTAIGKAYNGTTVTGRTPADPVNDPQSIIDNNVLRKGDTIYIDNGTYSFNHDIVITEADSGSRNLPFVIQGAVAPGVTSITRTATGTSDAVFLIYDTDGAVAPALEGITIRDLNVQGGKHGIFLFNAVYCNVLNNTVHHNGRNGAAGINGEGSGIVVRGGGTILVDSNKSYNNGGSGGTATTTGAAGGVGFGFGILNIASSNNIISNNECYANGAQGGAGGGATGRAGDSRSTGIQINGGSENSEVRNNIIRDTVATGYVATTRYAGSAYAYGIQVIDGSDYRITQNRIYGLRATGGNSTSQNGGQALVTGISASTASELLISSNLIYNNQTSGGLGATTSSAFSNGESDAIAMWCTSTPGAIISNNLGFDNSATAFNKRGSEIAGAPYAGGFFGVSSTGLRILNNTFYRNRITLSGGGSISDQSGQIFLFSSATGATFKNNICVSFDPYCPAVSLDAGSQVGLTSDYNDLFSSGGNIGAWGNTFHSTLAAWRSGTSKDANSKSVDPGFYDLATNNYRLKSTSGLIDAGTSLTEVSQDADGESRPSQGPTATVLPAFDIGYDEYVDSDGDTLPDVIETNVTFTNANDRDSDLDGLPDNWEVSNGLDPNSAAGINGASGDPDGDGATNLQEYQGNSNPKLASSVPAQNPVITSAAPAGSNLFILEDDTINFTATATVGNGATIAYSWRVDGVVKASTPSYNFVTTSDSSGATTLSKAYAVEVRATSGGNTTTRSWTVTVNNRNHAPVLQQMSSLRVRPGNTIQLSPAYSDPDNQNTATGDNNSLSVTYSGFMTNSTKTVTTADLGAQSVTVTVYDDGNPALSAQQTIEINVVDARLLITESNGSTTVSEQGLTDTYSVALAAPPVAPVVVTPTYDRWLVFSPNSLNFTAANWNIPQNITVSVPADQVVQGDRGVSISQVITSQDNLYGSLDTPNVAATIKDLPIDAWRTRNFSLSQSQNPSISGDAADPNNNGLKNLTEYALGGNPLGTSDNLSILPVVSRGTSSHMQMTLNRFLDRTDLKLTVQASDSPGGPWTNLAQSIGGGTFTDLGTGSVITEDGAGNTRSVNVRDLYPASDPAHPNRFLRLDILRQ